MKLRPSLRIQQNLSLLGGAFLLASAACAQTDAVIIMKDNSQRQTKVIGVSASGSSVEITTPDGAGRLGLPLAQIKEVRMAPPAELNQALALYQQKNYDAALAALQKLVAKYRGLPVAWAQQATATIGSVHLAKGDVPAAETAFKEFQKLYPGQGTLQSDVGLSLVAIARKDYAAAKAKLQPVADEALKEKNVNPANALAYSATFLGLGQIQEAEGNFAEALEQYLRTVTLFYHDRAAAALAQERADTLRKEHKDVAVP
jgi:tetratricopeptide (TPR) repeat protein